MSAWQALWPVAVLVVTAAGVLVQRCGSWTDGWWLLPWGLSLVFFGLPHGAVDHDVMFNLRPPLATAAPRWTMAAILTGYLGLCLIVLGGWFVVPQTWFAAFILLTWAHWGLADLWWSWHRDPAYFHGRGHRVVFALWRGALPMLIPLATDPRLFRQTAVDTCQLFLHRAPDFRWLEQPATRLAALGCALALGGWEFLLTRQGARTRWLNLAEGAALLVMFGALPALVSVGFYFAFWHGLRHICRLLARKNWTMRQFVWKALPNTLGALALLTALAWLLQPSKRGGELVGVYLALIAALTVPHALVVTALDVRDGLWRRA
jgi:Brp/Blh family beta-carotene 15,15'-monooxygenase